MNRENKRKTYDKHYYKTHPCDESFTCRSCGWLVTPQGAGSQHRNHCPTACAASTWTLSPATGRPTAAG